MRSFKARATCGLAIAAAALVAGGCAGMSQDECRSLDWRTIGYEDGVAGYQGDHIARYREACGKYGVRTDLDRYREGRAEGLREFCRPPIGYRLGARGASYGGVCPAELEPAFLRAFEDGHQLYVLSSRVSETEAEIGSKRRELARLEHGIIESSAEAVSSDAAPDQRAQAVLDAAHRAERVGQLKDEIRQLNEDDARYQSDLEGYRASHPPID